MARGVFALAEFKSRIAGRFYAEFYFYILAFLVILYFALQPHRNQWLVVVAVISGLLAVEALYLLYRNLRNASKSFVKVDKTKIVVADGNGVESIDWNRVEKICIGWESEDKWLERIFGLDPSVLIKKKGAGKKKEFDLGVSPDFFKTQEILVEMQRLYPKKIFFV
ncbi:MAG: hypothetical protein V1717_02720 [Candidatus Micrarchaeota archaeon]